MTIIVPLLGELAMKSTAILAIVALFDLLVRRLSAAERHLLWASALGVLLILPLAVCMAPALRVDPPGFESVASLAPLLESPIGADIQPTAGPSPESTTRLAVPQRQTLPSAIVRLRTLIEQHIGWLVALIYVAVATLLLAQLVWRLLQAHRDVSTLSPVTDAAVLQRAEELRVVMRLTRPLSLRTSMDRTPWAWGMRRPIVALPAGFEQSPEDQQRAALLHECAHVARFDFATTLAAHVVRSLYWFNPLAWLAWSRLQRECERACDDAVLAAGVSPTAYASQLLALAHIRGSWSPVLPLGTPMLRLPKPGDRIASLLAHGRRRNATSARKIGLAALLAASLVAPLASLQSQSRVDAVASELVHLWRMDGPVIEVVRNGDRFRYNFLSNIDVFSPNGQRVAILPDASGSDRMVIRSATDGGLVHDIRYPQEVGLAYEIAFSPTGAIALGRYGGVSLYDGGSPGSPLATFQTDPIPEDPPCRNGSVCRATIGSIAFSPDDTLLAFQEVRSTLPAQNSEGFVYVVETATGRRIAKLEAITGRPTHVAFSPDGRRLVAMHYTTVSGRRGPIGFRVWDTVAWELENEVSGLGQGSEPLAIGATVDTAFAAVYSTAKGLLELRDLERQRVLWSVPLFSPPFDRKPDMVGGEQLALDHVAIAPNGKFIVGYEGAGWMIRRGPLDEPDSLGYFSAIVVRDTRDGSIVATYDIRNVKGLAISPDSKTLLYSVGFHQTYLALAQLP